MRTARVWTNICRWNPVREGETLLHLVANSGCEKKASLLLERIMSARVKLIQTRNLTHREGSRSIGAYKELSSQEMELTKMYEELEQNRSVLRLLLQNCPDSICHLLDR